MIDPIGAHARVTESVISYIRTAFGTRFPSLEAERERLLRVPGALCQHPWIEPLPRYESSGKAINQLGPNDLPGLSAAAAADFRDLAARGLMGDFPLHRHQLEMLTKALAGQSCVITAGTGSGKTESSSCRCSRTSSVSRRRGPHRWLRRDTLTTGGLATTGATSVFRSLEGSGAGGSPCGFRSAAMSSGLPRCGPWSSTR